MAWETELVEMLQVMTGDFDGTVHSTVDLERVILVASQLVLNELDFAFDFRVNVDEADIVPDPTDNATRDDAFINLTAMKAACIINRGQALKLSGTLVKVRDFGGLSVDNTAGFNAQFQLLLKGGWCAVYQEEKLAYEIGGMIPGVAILSPFRLYAGSYGRYRSDHY